ncbi:hypothetical protein HPP92_010597 [Vanilla planifolia]|uniref:Uncharacterized protein n=1 Tax=Vanilla planifolia TaxID=51239 RepID=A0A835UXQ1_VANPL|nr:hypothetical protein HPP92_010597 [Vanilla planifolia]
MACGSEKQQSPSEEEDMRRGPWTVEEDLLLINYISKHGEGRWNSLAKFAGLKRTGKSCRLRWLNYLRPDVRRGNITAEEQLLILELHCRLGNRWSKIAQHLPGRTDNEIKNYWRTRVQKQAKQLKCDVNSKKFRDAVRFIWMPHLLERIRAAADVPPLQTAVETLPVNSTSVVSDNSSLSDVGSSSTLSSTGAAISAGGFWSLPRVSMSLPGGEGVEKGVGLADAHFRGGWSELPIGDETVQELCAVDGAGVNMWNEESLWFYQ